MPRAAVRSDTAAADGPRLTGAAADVYGTESARALFRRGLVEQVSPDLPSSGGPPAGPAANNGDAPLAPRPRPDRPRRTRPLRAT